MADKDQVEPTDESRSDLPSRDAGPADAADTAAVHDDAELVEDPDGPDTEDDRFDEIVREGGLESEPADEADVDDADEKALEPAGVGAAAGTGRTARERRAAKAPKGVATPSRDNRPVKPERTTPAGFVRESVGELRKVVYPTGQQLINYFIVVLVFVLFVIAYVSLLDLGLGWAIFKVFS